ncbi:MULTISPECIES: hypothetical protein [Ruegeria]|uniref:hypothetical protein n=1 Tax=Ruegeria TaxID=97050 RepID=UPI00147C78EC|nr:MULTISPECIES: hypothetical protein [Ruegeria]UWR08996.1 hypothetical protein K3752_08625 [Ruegeria sp. B32]
MLYLKRPSTKLDQPVATHRVSLDQRIDELRNKPATYLNHGEALLLQGMAAASLRPQRIVADKIALDDD